MKTYKHKMGLSAGRGYAYLVAFPRNFIKIHMKGIKVRKEQDYVTNYYSYMQYCDQVKFLNYDERFDEY